ncbi:sensor histidine kinase [Aneurinibacillus soli]|uniref:sensor histidine kinase n=1 Tax=Aneurinibacillus soli TaxID=1500254 RepID=UPI0011B847B9|nr:sensor histidine kinase [Aneurinibacillus soli]
MASLNISSVLKKDIFILVLMMFTVPLAGQLNFYPMNETFRVSFGAPTFFFFLLLFRKIPVVLPGFLTGILMVGFRILLDWTMQENFNLLSSFAEYYSSFFYYFTYAFLFYLVKVNRFYSQPLLLGCMGIVIEILADLVELLVQHFGLGTTITLAAFKEITIMAISHSFLVLSFFNMMKLYESQSRERQIRKQNEHMLMLISSLYEESVHLKKTLQNAESITKKSYDLYKRLTSLKEDQTVFPVKELGKQALKIAGEVHEIKKDNQRIFAGLSKLISDESLADYMDIHELVDIIVQTNEKYARLLGKNIEFIQTIEGSHPHYHVFTVLSIINNIVANAVEAITDAGSITIALAREHDSVEFRIGDNGPGITPKHKLLIFKPGFTSKYDHSGNSSTGIGLSYVKEVVEQLEGDITVQDGPCGKGSMFMIRLPVDHLIMKG